MRFLWRLLRPTQTTDKALNKAGADRPIQVSPAQSAFLFAGSGLTFYLVSESSVLLPYAPLGIGRYFGHGVAFLFFCVWTFFAFFYKYRNGQNGWQYAFGRYVPHGTEIKQAIKLVVAIPVGYLLIAFVTLRWPAYPTKWLATDVVVKQLHCSSVEQHGKTARKTMLIEARNDENGEILKFPWPENKTPKCPGVITVTGKTGYFGIYVTDVRGS